MQYDTKDIQRKSVTLTGLYVAVISCVIITVTGIFLGHDLLTVLCRALIVLALAWPTGCFFGFLGFKIFEESLKDEQIDEVKVNEEGIENEINK